MKPLGGDEFLVLYGAADSDVGVVKIKVNINGTRTKVRVTVDNRVMDSQVGGTVNSTPY